MTTAEYEKHAWACEQIRSQNEQLLDDFTRWLVERGSGGRSSIPQHVQRVGLYINTYLLFDDAVPARRGADRVGFFLGYWYAHHVRQWRPDSLRRYVGSLKKFYTFLRERGEISVPEWQELEETVRRAVAVEPNDAP